MSKVPVTPAQMTEEEKERHNIAIGALDCWCDPTYRKVCPECEGVVMFANCWRCNKVGTVPISREEAEGMGGGVITVHKEEIE